MAINEEEACVKHAAGGEAARGVVFYPSPNAEFGLPYVSLTLVQRISEDAVQLTFYSHVVTIRGKHLDGLVEEFTEHLVRAVQVSARSESYLDDAERVITEIRLQSGEV